MNGIDPSIELGRICRRNNVTVSDSQMTALRTFVIGLLEWNKKINLISRQDEQNVWFNHILHSLSLLFYVDVPNSISILDLGSGGGFPGIPLAIMRPGIRFTLLDSIRKKTMVLENLVGRIGLTNAAVVTGRGEELRGEQAFDLVVARAVAPLADLVRWTRPLVKNRPEGNLIGAVPTKGGQVPAPQLLALKGGDLEREIAGAKLAGGVKAITVINIAFDGSLPMGLEDKKLVLVEFHNT
jgi:16S rRNA (guanine527-N7)-methyltransferase